MPLRHLLVWIPHSYVLLCCCFLTSRFHQTIKIPMAIAMIGNEMNENTKNISLNILRSPDQFVAYRC